MFTQYLKIALFKNRKGVITTVNIPANVPICEFYGQNYTDQELQNLKNINIDDVLQVGPNVYLAPSGNIDDYIAHSCNPNCIVKANGFRAILYSLYAIQADNEITFDYSTTSTDDLNSWSMKCNCGSINCRKVISGFHLLSNNLQEEYKKKGIAALFIREPIFGKRV